jgi:hypothetical protein
MAAVARIVLDYKLTPTCYPGEIMTDMMYAIYPEGFYEVQCLSGGRCCSDGLTHRICGL